MQLLLSSGSCVCPRQARPEHCICTHKGNGQKKLKICGIFFFKSWADYFNAIVNENVHLMVSVLSFHSLKTKSLHAIPPFVANLPFVAILSPKCVGCEIAQASRFDRIVLMQALTRSSRLALGARSWRSRQTLRAWPTLTASGAQAWVAQTV